jgi:hypothetical protein
MRGAKKPVERTMRHMHDRVREKSRTHVNYAFMVLVGPSTTYGPAPTLI